MLEQTIAGAWVSLIEYSHRKNISVSTLRRKIKKQSIHFKLEEGRYLLWCDVPSVDESKSPVNEGSAGGSNQLESKVDKLQSELMRAHEELAELKTLLALYEEKLPQSLDQ